MLWRKKKHKSKEDEENQKKSTRQIFITVLKDNLVLKFQMKLPFLPLSITSFNEYNYILHLFKRDKYIFFKGQT